jgi:hypothetical protein
MPCYAQNMKPEYLGGSKASKEIFRFDDFELDRGTYELRHAGQRVRLQRLPLELLYLLVERHGQLVACEEIIERIWGKGVFVDSENSINTAMNKIRRALNDDADAPRSWLLCPPGAIALSCRFARMAPPSRYPRRYPACQWPRRAQLSTPSMQAPRRSQKVYLPQ